MRHAKLTDRQNLAEFLLRWIVRKQRTKTLKIRL